MKFGKIAITLLIAMLALGSVAKAQQASLTLGSNVAKLYQFNDTKWDLTKVVDPQCLTEPTSDKKIGLFKRIYG